MNIPLPENHDGILHALASDDPIRAVDAGVWSITNPWSEWHQQREHMGFAVNRHKKECLSLCEPFVKVPLNYIQQS